MSLENKVIEPNYAFIDGQNLYQSIRDQGWKLDYSKFRIYLREKYKVEKAYLFIGYISENQDLYTELQESGFLLKFKPVLHKEYGLKQGNGDFDTTVRYLRKKNKLGMVLSPNFDKCSALLKIQAREKIDFVNNFRAKVEKTEGINEKAPLEDETSRSAFS